MSKELHIIPFSEENTSLPLTKIPPLRGAYPDYFSTYGKSIPAHFNSSTFQRAIDEEPKDLFYVMDSEEGGGLLIGLVENGNNKIVPDHVLSVLGFVRTRIKVLIAQQLGILAQTGYEDNAGRRYKNDALNGIDPASILSFIKIIGPDLQRKPSEAQYRGVEGQLKLAKRIGLKGVGQIYRLATDLKIAHQLQWVEKGGSEEITKRFKEKILPRLEEFKGNRGQMKAAAEIGCRDLNKIYGIARTLGMVSTLKWRCIQIPYEEAAQIFEKGFPAEKLKGRFSQFFRKLRAEGKTNWSPKDVQRLDLDLYRIISLFPEETVNGKAMKWLHILTHFIDADLLQQYTFTYWQRPLKDLYTPPHRTKGRTISKTQPETKRIAYVEGFNYGGDLAFPAPEDTLVMNEQNAQLQQALQKLSPTERSIVELFLDEKIAEIPPDILVKLQQLMM